MEKEFLSTSKDSGQGNDQVQVNVLPNPTTLDRSSQLKIRSSTGIERSVSVNQPGLPFFTTLSLIIDGGESSMNLYSLTYDIPQMNSGGIIQNVNFLADAPNGSVSNQVIGLDINLSIHKSLYDKFEELGGNQGISVTNNLDDTISDPTYRNLIGNYMHLVIPAPNSPLAFSDLHDLRLYLGYGNYDDYEHYREDFFTYSFTVM